MSRRLVVRDAARVELRDAVEWYETQRAGLGVALEQAVQDTVDRVLRQPGMYAVEHSDTRLAPVDGYPFVVCYRVRTDRLVVVSVFHTSRDPAVWQGRA